MLGEDRYRALSKLNKDSKQMLNRNKEDAESTYEFYKNLEGNVQ